MNKLYLLAAVLVFGTTAALADPGGNACNIHPDAPFCQGGGDGENGNPGSQEQGQDQGQAQGQVQGQVLNNEVYQGTYVGVESDSNSSAESSSNSGSYSNASGGSVRNSNSVQGGRSDASSTASGGNAQGGVGVGGKSEASSGGNTQDISVDGDTLTDNSVLIYEDAENTAASASSVFAGYCQTGASGQAGVGGFSVVNPEAFCNHIRIAGVMQEAYEWEMKHGSATCAPPMDSVGPEGYAASDTCMNEQAQVYYRLYNENLLEANSMLNATEVVGKMDAFFGYLIRPMAVIGMLIWLI
jgi:hypothetical protein